jgi:riboflavin synthase
VDATIAVLSVEAEGDFFRVAFGLPPALSRWVVEKGSIALDGVSLTVASLGVERFDVAVIPETWRRTTLSDRRPGDLVNAEADILAKYVERLLADRGTPAAGSRDVRLRSLLGGG